MPAIDRSNRKFQVLGMHKDVARVRMFIEGEAVDEDFPIPRVISVEEQLEAAIMKRVAELEDK